MPCVSVNKREECAAQADATGVEMKVFVRALGFLAILAALSVISACDDDDKSNPTGDVLVDGDLQLDDTSELSDLGDTDATTQGDGINDGTTIVEPERVTCPKTLVAPATGLCSYTAGDSMLLIEGQVLAGTTIYENGAVLIDRTSQNAKITCVGCDCDSATGASTASVLSCAKGVISPGLINPHDHITYAVGRPQGHGDERFDHRNDWRRGLRQHTEVGNYPGVDKTREGVLYGELRMLFGGATSVTGAIGTANTSGLLRNLDNGAYTEGLAGIDVKYQTFPLGDVDGTMLAQGCAYPSIDSESELGANIYMPHISEGIDNETHNEFGCTSGGETGSRDLIAENTTIVHGIGLSAADIQLVANRGAKLIWSPRSNVDLYGNTASVTTYKHLGVNIALGTDWSTSGSMNVPRELRCADELNRNYFGNVFTDQDLWLMSTYNSAVAMGAETQLGLLAVGYIADIAIFDGTDRAEYRAIIEASPETVALVMRGGTPLLGDTAIMSGLMGAQASTCETETVCGREKLVCAQADAGITMAAIRGAVNTNSYELYFCDDPLNEPSCVPFRPGDYVGMTSATDQDGDGIDDVDDNCPTIFNPVRVMDGTAQPDTDNDGFGDVCDVCPLNEGGCELPDPTDRDKDTIENFQDNCPNVANTDQADADDDGTGDLCDSCPNYANPGNGACLTTIYDIKQGVTAVGTSVLLQDVVVTGSAAGEGFFVQVHPDDAGYVSAEYSGLYVFARGLTPFPAQGDRLTLQGAVAEWYGQLQLSSSSVTINSSNNALPAPTAAVPANIVAGGNMQAAYEGVLITVSNVTVSAVQPAPGPGETAPTDAFVVNNGLRVDNFFYTVTPMPQLNDTYEAITGVLRWSNDFSKLEPRGPSDMGPPVLLAFDSQGTFLEAGTTGVPTPELQVRMSAAVVSDTVIALTYPTPAVLTGPATVTVLAGQASANLTLTGVAANTTPAVVTATLDGRSEDALVRVYGAAEVRQVVAVTPDPATVRISGTVDLTVELNLPAGANEQVTLVASSAAISVVSPMTVPQGQVTGTFTVTAGAAAVAGETVTASIGASSAFATVDVVETPQTGLIITEVFYNGTGADDGFEWVKLYNGTSAAIDLSGYSIGYAGAGYSVGKYALSGTVAPGGCFVAGGVASDASNGSPVYNLAQDFDPDIQNSGAVADAVGLFHNAASAITDASVPIDAVIYGTTNSGGLVDETGTAGNVDVGNAPATNSIRRLGDGTWEFNPAPTPNLCPPF